MKDSITLEAPRLTAYALGDLQSSQDRAFIEAALVDSPELQAYVDDIRSLGETLTQGFDAETLPKTGKVVKPRVSAWRYVIPLGLAASLAVLATWLPQRLGTAPEMNRSVAEATPEMPESRGAVAVVDSVEPVDSPIVETLDELPIDAFGTVAVNTAFFEFASGEMGGGGAMKARATRGRPKKAATADLGRATPEVADTQRETSLTGDPVTGVGTLLMSSMQDTYKAEAGIKQIQMQLANLENLEGERLIQSAAMLDINDPTLQALLPSYQKIQLEKQELLKSGFTDKHPSIQKANEKLSQTHRMLVTATESVRNTLKTRLDMANHALLVSKEMEEPRNAESYAPTVDNAFKDIVNPGDERATFSTDVDTASYSNVRRFLTNGQRPPRDAIRVEEMINYFYYDYPNPAEDGKPFSVKLEVNDAPWAPGHRLLRIGLKARDVMVDKRPDSNLVFLIDVSGSMSPFDKLPLLKKSLKAMVGGFTERDMVSLVVYFGQSRVHLPPTPGNESSRIIASVDQLKSGGSTNGASGIQLAYELASKHRIVNGVNRVLLATDGDFNVGTTDTKQLIAMAKARAKEDQIFLTVLGLGTDNVKDDRMEQLANQVDGVYHYIDSEREGRKVLVDEMSATLVPMAKDVKIQVEFNPAKVKSYRIIGYGNRLLTNRDFTDDKKNAGEMGAGHTVTAFYEIVPTGHEGIEPNDAPLKYRSAAEPAPAPDNASNDIVTVRLRYKEPHSETSQSFETSLTDEGSHWNAASEDFRFAAAVAAFGMKLRNSPHCQASYDSIRQWAEGARNHDEYGWRAEMIELIARAAGPITY